MSQYNKTDPFNAFVSWLSHEIIIEVNIDLFVFNSAKITLKIPTYVYILNQKGHMDVISVGKEAIDEPRALKVQLFEDTPYPFLNVDKCEYLEAFIRYGVRHVISRYAIISPTIIFRGIELFDSIFHGYQKGLFNLIASRACAGAVFFE